MARVHGCVSLPFDGPVFLVWYLTPQLLFFSVSHDLNIQTPRPSEHNVGNYTLLEGSRRMGYACKVVPQNVSGDLHHHNQTCGARCTMGCRSYLEPQGRSGKMDAARRFVKPLMEQADDETSESSGGTGGNYGGRVVGMDGFEIDRIVFSDESRTRAIGAIGRLQSSSHHHRLLVLSDRTVLSAGSLNSPVILQRSGLTNPSIGRHLYLHPTLIVYSIWDQPIHPSTGLILSTAITEFDNLDHGGGHGVKLEGMNMLPSLGMFSQPWSGGAEYKQQLLDYQHTMGHIVLCRESAPGRIWWDSAQGKRRIDYEPSAKDRGYILQGYIALTKLLYTMGAREIYTSTVNGPRWKRASDGKTSGGSWADDKAFVEFLRQTEQMGHPMDRTCYGSAHQMGTCRMGSSPRDSVVNTRGQVWGVGTAQANNKDSSNKTSNQGSLYVADASVFPSASGVNPMMTTMTFGEWIGRRCVEDMLGERGRGDATARL